ncbi:hypothetical protein ACFV61_26490, partial [Kitasatospora sp. NPDC059817]
MLRAGSSPARRPSAPLLGWLLPTAVMAAAVAAAAAVVSAGVRAEVLWCGATGTVLVAVVAAESARRVQAIIHRQAKDLREMEDRHGNDPAVFDDL